MRVAKRGPLDGWNTQPSLCSWLVRAVAVFGFVLAAPPPTWGQPTLPDPLVGTCSWHDSFGQEGEMGDEDEVIEQAAAEREPPREEAQAELQDTILPAVAAGEFAP